MSCLRTSSLNTPRKCSRLTKYLSCAVIIAYLTTNDALSYHPAGSL